MFSRISVASCTLALCLSLCVSAPLHAAGVAFIKEAASVGAAASTTYGTVGYDLYGTTPVGTNTPTNNVGPYSTGTRLTQLPGFVTSITAPANNQGASGFNFYATINNPAGGQVESGYTLARVSSPGIQSDVGSITIGANPPSLFDIGVLENATGTAAGGGAANDYPDDLRIRESVGGSADSGLIATNKASATLGALDVYFFQVTGASAGDVYTISAVENGRNNDQGDYHATLVGVLFPATASVPEPGSIGMLCAAGMTLLARRRRAA
jgi:hypothetical protein